MPKAIVIHPEIDKPIEIIEWSENELLDVLYKTIQCECVDSSPMISTPRGDMIFWVDDTGLVNGDPVYNDYAIGIARGAGWGVPALAGIVVITGGYDAIGNTLGVTDDLIEGITFAIDQVRSHG